MKLVITEKPSVAMSIAGVIGAGQKQDGYYEGNNYLVSWCVGHLVEPVNADAYDERYKKWEYNDLPIIPEKWRYEVTRDKQKQFKVLKGLMNHPDVDTLICATDAGREGELIFRLVYHKAGCQKPFERLWISSMEDSAIKDGFDSLKPGAEYDNLYASALCRSQADWLVGINATRLFSVLYGASLSVGRVQSPTLAMLTERDAQIRDFKKEKYYHVHINPAGADATGEKIKVKTEAEAIQAVCDKQQAVLRSLTTEEKTVNPPKLYDLTTLQRDANRIYGYTAQQTLDLAQALYEKKLLTYPRTDSRFLTSDMLQTIPVIVNQAALLVGFIRGNVGIPIDYIGQVINDSKVSDHHAIIPTLTISDYDASTLPETERNILHLVATRLVCAIHEKHVFEAVTAVFECGGHSFTTKGKTITTEGWKAVDRLFRNSLKLKAEKEDEEKTLPDGGRLPELTEGQTFDGVGAAITEHTTTPPKPYTEDTLLSAMERAGSEDMDEDAERQGLGTPATRAGVIEKLVHRGFVERRKKQLFPTEKGINLIRALPENLTSPKLTAEWENALTEIAKGGYAAPEFMAGIAELTWTLVRENTAAREDLKPLFEHKKQAIGVCPRCGESVFEGKKNFYCSNRDCSFSMWKNDRFFTDKKKTLTPELAARLLKDGKIPVKGLHSAKTGNKYDAVVVLADTGDKYVNFKLEFSQKKED